MAPMIVEVPRDHERYKSGQSIVESQRDGIRGLIDALSRIAVPSEMAAQRQTPRSPRDLQDREYESKCGKIRTVPVRLANHQSLAPSLC